MNLRDNNMLVSSDENGIKYHNDYNCNPKTDIKNKRNILLGVGILTKMTEDRFGRMAGIFLWVCLEGTGNHIDWCITFGNHIFKAKLN